MRYLLPVLLIAIPLISYWIWYRLAKAKLEHEKTGDLPAWQDAPWTWIVVGTLAAVSLGFVALALVGPDDTAGTYVPARYEDGKVIPGYIEDGG
jgi:hypothetical protein